MKSGLLVTRQLGKCPIPAGGWLHGFVVVPSETFSESTQPHPRPCPWFSHVTLSRPQFPFQVVDSELQRKRPPSFEFRNPFIKILQESARCSAGSGWLGAHRLSLPPSKASW